MVFSSGKKAGATGNGGGECQWCTFFLTFFRRLVSFWINDVVWYSSLSTSRLPCTSCLLFQKRLKGDYSKIQFSWKSSLSLFILTKELFFKILSDCGHFMQKIFVCWCTVSEMVALKCKSSDPDVGEHDSDLTTSGMHMVPPACIRNDKSCHLWRYDVYNCTTYIMKSTSSNSTTDFRKKKKE